jgi:hypothetical protein
VRSLCVFAPVVGHYVVRKKLHFRTKSVESWLHGFVSLLTWEHRVEADGFCRN